MSSLTDNTTSNQQMTELAINLIKKTQIMQFQGNCQINIAVTKEPTDTKIRLTMFLNGRNDSVYLYAFHELKRNQEKARLALDAFKKSDLEAFRLVEFNSYN